jgi:C4-dicarboxylate transporter DctM subunit
VKLLAAAPRLTRSRRIVFGAIAVGLFALALSSGTADAAPEGMDPDFDEVGDRPIGKGLTLMFAALAAMIALGMPLFVIIGVLAALAFWQLGEDFDGLNTLDVFSDEVTKLTNKNVLLAIPFFVASGAIMSAGSIASRLVAFARALVGWMPGGLAIATVWACVFFAAISGSSPVTVIAVGSMMYPALLKSGYERRFSLGLLSSAGSLGILIPPSIPMLVYAIVAGGRKPLDVSELFLAGVIPGLLIGVLLSAYSFFTGLKQGARDKFTSSDVWTKFTEGFWAISLPFVILGGIYSGVFTPTEAAAASVVYALVVEILIHREITIFDLPKVLTDACVTMGTILIIMALAVSLNIFLVEEMIPNRVVAWIQSMDLSPIGFLLIVNLFLLIVGAVMDSISAILIIAPLLAPIAYELGLDPVHLGVIFIVNLEIGYLTPPIGINLFVASSVFKRPMGEVARGVLPFIGLMAIGLGIVAYVPTVSMGPVNVFLRDKPFYEPFPGTEDSTDTTGDGEPQAPQTQVGPTGKKVLSVEELMEMDVSSGGWDEDDDDGDWGEEEDEEKEEDAGTETG